MSGSSLVSRAAIGAAGVGVIASFAQAVPVSPDIETRTFLFAGVGISYTAIVLPDDPIVGREIVETRITLDVSVTAGDAANFATDIALPIEPFPGNQNVLALFGSDIGWSGLGEFSYTETTDRFNGEFISTLYGAETFGVGGAILSGSRIEVDYIVPAPGSAALLGMGGLVTLRRRR